MPIIDEIQLTPFKLCESDNFQSTPNEFFNYIKAFPEVINKIESDKKLAKLSHILLEDEQYNELFPEAIQERAIRWINSLSIVISVVWRYLNQNRTLIYNPVVLDELILNGFDVWKREYFNLTITVPLFGLSGKYQLQEMKLGNGWSIRCITDREQDRLQRADYYYRLPCTMAYSAEAPPVVGYVLTCSDYQVPLAGFAAGWNIIKPEYLPLNEIKNVVSLLQVATDVSTDGDWYSIYCPLLLYYSDDWAVNPFSNPFSPDYVWPLNNSLNYRPWYGPSIQWGQEFLDMYNFLGNMPEPYQEQYYRALRWFNDSINCEDIADRFMKLFIAIETLLLDKDERMKRGKGKYIASKCAELITSDYTECRKWRKFIDKAYQQIRNPLFHEGISISNLTENLLNDTVLESPEVCAGMLEFVFRQLWAAVVKRVVAQ